MLHSPVHTQHGTCNRHRPLCQCRFNVHDDDMARAPEKATEGKESPGRAPMDCLAAHRSCAAARPDTVQVMEARDNNRSDQSQRERGTESQHTKAQVIAPRRRHRTRPTFPTSDPGGQSLRTARGDRRPRRARAAADMMTCGVGIRSSTTLGSSQGPTRTASRRGRVVWRAATRAMADVTSSPARWCRARAPMCQADPAVSARHSRAPDWQS